MIPEIDEMSGKIVDAFNDKLNSNINPFQNLPPIKEKIEYVQ